ncbi:MAG: hypothetical protein ABI851_13540 [Saprospiraceae bacterium]
MKKITILFFAIATMFSFTQCSKSSGNELSNADSRAKVISELMDNDAYSKEIMTAMKAKHGEVIVSTSCDMMKEDKATCTKIMDSMMEMCMIDSDMCKMMMGKTMEMSEMDKEKCKMMINSMKEHPKLMKDMKDMGICDMK